MGRSLKSQEEERGESPRAGPRSPALPQKRPEFRPSPPLHFLLGELQRPGRSLFGLPGVETGAAARPDRSSEVGPRSPDFWTEWLGKVTPPPVPPGYCVGLERSMSLGARGERPREKAWSWS